MSEDPFANHLRSPSSNDGQSIFSIRGDLDGGDEQEDYSQLIQFIGVTIGEEEFLLPISYVNEIIMLPRVTYVPGAPTYIAGVINLRGNIIPAINLRHMMNLPDKDPDQASRVIVVRYQDFLAGIVVDSITYVVTLANSEVENHSLNHTGMGADLISSIGNRSDRINGILDVAKIITATADGELQTEDQENAA